MIGAALYLLYEESVRGFISETTVQSDKLKNTLCYAVFDEATNRMIGFSRVVTDYVSMF